MVKQFISSESSEELLLQTQADLLEILLSSEEELYPWNPTDPSTEVYFAQAENDFNLFEGWSEAEITKNSQNFLEQMNQCWQSDKPATKGLEISLYKRFAQVPKVWLEAIATKAQNVFSDHLSLADQLVHCVSSLLPEWGEDDLQVLARPLAYAMRGKTADEAVESTLSTIQPVDWNELSEIERARLTLAIANFALNQLKSEGIDNEEE